MSCIKPLAAPIVILFARPILSVLIPILNESVKLTIELLNPDIETASWLFNSMNGNLLATTSVPLFHSNTASSKLVSVVLILEIPRPTISSTSARKPEPLVPVSSNSVRSTT